MCKYLEITSTNIYLSHSNLGLIFSLETGQQMDLSVTACKINEGLQAK